MGRAASHADGPWRLQRTALAVATVLAQLAGLAGAGEGEGAAPRRLPGLHRRGRGGNLDLSELLHSNLGGHGPDKGNPLTIRFKDVTAVSGTLLDLVIVAEGNYTPFDVHQNGNTGRIGNVNVKVGTQVKLTLKFFRAGTDVPAPMDRFYLTLYLVDQREKVHVDYFSSGATAAGFERYCFTNGTVLNAHVQEDPARLSFTAPFGESTEPSDPALLTQAEKNQAVTFFLIGAFEIPIVVETVGGLMEDAGINFAFSGTNSIEETCHSWKPSSLSDTTTTRVDHHDCRSWDTRWSDHHKARCCKHKQSGENKEDMEAWPLGKREWCCAYEHIGCTASTTTALAAEKDGTGNHAGCGVLCKQNGISASCNSRIEWIAKNQYQDQAHPCWSAHSLVLDICDACKLCRKEDACLDGAATQANGTAEHYNCEHEYGSWKKSWSDAKKVWCCQEHHKGCHATGVRVTTTTGTTTATAIHKPTTTTTAVTTSTSATTTTTKTTEPYYCTAGSAASVVRWSEEQKKWCCERYDKGCPATRATATASSSSTTKVTSSTLTATVAQSTERYDCEEGYSDWKKLWTYVKRSWCCEHWSRGCRLLTKTTTTSEPFNCVVGFAYWEQGWTNRKKAWCCEHYHRGCPPTTTSGKSPTTDNPKSSAAERSSGFPSDRTRPCRPGDCDVDYASSRVREEFDCHEGYEHWETRWTYTKKAWCCEHHSRGCRYVTDPPTTTVEPHYTCKDSHNHNFQGLQGLLLGALGKQRTKGHTTEDTWSPQKREWCCRKYNMGCTTTTALTTGPELYHCNGSSGGWDYKQKAWCCEHHARGCRLAKPPTFTTLQAYNCLVGLDQWAIGWSDGKKLWCCAHAGKGCSKAEPTTTSELFDCEAGYANWATGWSYGKKAWCCRRYARGCHIATTTQEPYDCEVGYSSLGVDWSTGKQAYCCRIYGRGCTTTTTMELFDCTAGYSSWQIGWSVDKQQWCCTQYGRGCAPARQQLMLADGQLPEAAPMQGPRQPSYPADTLGAVVASGLQRLFASSRWPASPHGRQGTARGVVADAAAAGHSPHVGGTAARHSRGPAEALMVAAALASFAAVAAVAAAARWHGRAAGGWLGPRKAPDAGAAPTARALRFGMVARTYAPVDSDAAELLRTESAMGLE